MILLNGVPVHWRSNRQPVSADSPACAEIYALKEGVKDGRLFDWVAEEMGMSVSWPFVVQVDNKQAISFQQDTCINSKIRGSIDMRMEWVEELRDLKIVKTIHVSGEDNLADILTKCLKGPKQMFFYGGEDRRFSKIRDFRRARVFEYLSVSYYYTCM